MAYLTGLGHMGALYVDPKTHALSSTPKPGYVPYPAAKSQAPADKWALPASAKTTFVGPMPGEAGPPPASAPPASAPQERPMMMAGAAIGALVLLFWAMRK